MSWRKNTRALSCMLALTVTSTVIAQEPPAREERPARERPQQQVRGEVRVFRIEHAAAREIGESVARIFSPEVMVVSDDRTNSLVCSAGSEQTLSKVEALIKELDQPAAPPGPSRHVVTSVTLASCDAESVAQRLLSLTANNARRQADPEIRIVADARANVVWLAGDADGVEKLVEVARRMDEGSAAASERDVSAKAELRFYVVQHVDAVELAGTLNEVLALMKAPARLVADGLSNRIITFATPEEHAAITQLIRTLDETRAAATPAPATQP